MTMVHQNGIPDDGAAIERLVALGDLEGRRVAVEKFSLGYLMLARALDRANLGLRDVQAVPMDLSQMSDAMRRGVVDAAVSYPPESVAMMADGLGQVVFSSRDIPGEILDLMVVKTDVLKANPKLGRALVGAWYETIGVMMGTDAKAKAARRVRSFTGPPGPRPPAGYRPGRRRS